MLGKLLKYEIKSSLRTLLPLYLGTLVVALACGLNVFFTIQSQGASYSGGDGLFSAMITLLLFALFVAIAVLTGVVIIQRFNRNLLGDEGYLMFTLPVTEVQLVLSKLITAMLWSLASIVVMGLSGFIIGGLALIAAGDVEMWMEFWNEMLFTIQHWNLLSNILLTGCASFFSMIAVILVIYLAMMVGQLEQFSKYRMPASVIAFFVISWLFSAVSSIIQRMLGLGWSNFYGYSSNYGMDFYQVLMTYDLVMTIVQAVICFAAVVWLMKKKLSL